MAEVERAFIVQIETATGGSLAGHVEHVLTGQACAFATLEKLAEFMASTLGDAHTQQQPATPPGEDQ
jgi:hypothetical protein